MSACGYKLILLGIIVTLSSWKTVVTAQDYLDIKDYIEGSNVVVLCNATESEYVFWTNTEGKRWEGNVLNITNVTRDYEGLYSCVNQTSREEIYSFFLNVLYPAHVVVINSSKHTLNENETFWMYIQATGNPDPVTTLVAINTGKVIFREVKEGFFNITMPSINCSDTGLYALTCDNQLANTSQTESLSVWCSPKPDPNYPIVSTITPRLHDLVNLTLHATGNPPPSYDWYHNGTQLFNHTDTHYTTVLTLNDMSVQYFGDYMVVMRNSLGNDSVSFRVKADGPPEPVSHINVTNVSITSANITFTTGYDYNDSQTFIIRNKDSNLTSCKDFTSGKGGEPFSCALNNLTEDTIYNITVISSNSRGESKPNSEFVVFSTYGVPKPDPAINDTYIFAPSIPDVVTMTFHAVGYPPPTFQWWHNGAHLNSSQTNYISSLTVKILDGKDFGKYVLNMTNKVGNSSMVYQVLAECPPEPVSHINVTNVSITSANITFTTGYDYNDSQTFIIRNKKSNLTSCKDFTSGKGGEQFTCALNNLTEDTLYNITVISSSSRGESKPNSECVVFSTYGVPKPDPAINDTYIFAPRIPDDVTMTIHAVGYPSPTFQWWHNGVHLNSSQTNYTSSLTVKIQDGKDFGEYVLNMTNKVGNSSMVYQVLAEGPPDAVSNLDVSNITETSANITFTSGYDYNDTQTFVVQNYTNGNETGPPDPVRDLIAGDFTSESVLLYWRPGFNYGSNQTFTIFQVGNEKELQDKIEDTTKGNFSMNETYKLTGLLSSTTYTVNVMASNEHGKASQYSNSVNFTTSDSDDGGTTAENVGYVVGGIGFVVLILVIISLIRCYMARRGNYGHLEEEEERS